MHIEEARWLKDQLLRYRKKISPLINLGSSTKNYREVYQPFIHELIFEPINANGVKVYHSDIKNDDGVDLVGDITDDKFKSELRDIGAKSVLCSNLLEHVESPSKIAEGILEIIPVGGFIFITVPYKYPLHMDPIDTMYRPDPQELQKLFKNTKLLTEDIISVGNVWEGLRNNLKEFLWMLMRSLIPFYKFNGWLTTINKLAWMTKDRKITCVLLEKV